MATASDQPPEWIKCCWNPKEDYYTMFNKNRHRFSESKPTPPSPRLPVASDSSQNRRTAEAALEYYNKKRHTSYKLIDPIASDGLVWAGGIWYHCNFSATFAGGPEKLFFAEMKVDPSTTRLVVTVCRSLEGLKTTHDCDMCGSGGEILHPTGTSRAGLHQFKKYNLRPRRKC